MLRVRHEPKIVTASLAILLCYAAVSAVDHASRKYFWFDEICAIAVAGQHSFPAIWSALERSADSAPPPFYWIERRVSGLAHDPHIGYRLASLIGFLATLIALFVFAQRRAGPAAGLVAAAIPLVTSLFKLYAVEARPYALAVGCVAWALVMWQSADRRGRMVALGILLAAAASMHYYAVFAVAPLAMAEAARTLRVRRFRVGVWCALACAALPLIGFLPLLAQLRRYFGPAYWAKPTIHGIPSMYDTILALQDWWGAGLAAVLAGVMLWTLTPAALRKAADKSAVPAEERVLILGLILLPAIGYLLARVFQGGLMPRYVLGAVLGIALAGALLSAAGGRRTIVGVLGLVLCVFALQEINQFRRGLPRAASAQYPDNAVLYEMVTESGVSGLPVVISDGMLYLPMAYYDSHEGAGFEYLLDAAGALAYAKSNTVDLTLEPLAAYLPLHVEHSRAFLATHSRFLLFAEDNNDDQWNWLPQKLVDTGYSLRPMAVGRSGHHILYLVEASPRAR